MTIQPIVEGHGEVEAVPVLLRRLRDQAQTYPLQINSPIRRHSSDFFEETELRKAVRLALKQACDGILLIVDGDGTDDCPKDQGPEILSCAEPEASGKPCEVVMAYRSSRRENSSPVSVAPSSSPFSRKAARDWALLKAATDATSRAAPHRNQNGPSPSTVSRH